MMEESSSTAPVPDNNMEQQPYIREVEPESKVQSIVHPVQKTCSPEAIAQRISSFKRNALPQYYHKSSNNSNSLAVNSESFSDKGIPLKPLPRENSQDAQEKDGIRTSAEQLVSPSQHSPRTEDRLNQNATAENSAVRSQKPLTTEVEAGSLQVEESPIKDGQFHTHDPEVSTEKEDTGDEQNFTECHSGKGAPQKPSPTKTSLEADTSLACNSVTKMEGKDIAQDGQSTEIMYDIQPDVNNVDFGETKNTFHTTDDPEVSTEKEDSDDQSLKAMDNAVKEPQTENGPASDDHTQVPNTNACHKTKNISLWMMVIPLLILISLELVVFPQNGSTAFVDFSVNAGHTPMPDLSPGVLLAIRRLGGLYYHYLIYIGDGYVVHKTGGREDWLNFTKGRIKKDKLDEVIGPRDVVRIENETWEGKEPLPPQEIRERAMSKIGERGFHLFLYNCEHFARWCRYGETLSKQANNLLTMLLSIFVNKYFPVLL